MKKFFYFLLALPLVFAACDKNPEPEPKPEVKDPVLNVTETSLDFDAEGAEATIHYSVENAVEGTKVEATCAAEWVIDLTVAENITFVVEANEGEARETSIVVAYGDLQKSVAVKQAAKGEEPKPTAPKLEAVTAEVEYSWDTTMGEVEFKLENPIEGVDVEAKSGASWISQVQVKENKILFAMSENKGEAREGKITAQYGMLEPIEFTVKQGAYVAPDPVLEVATTELEFTYEGGDGTFAYTLENPVDGVELEVKADVEWISNIAAADGTVSFTVAANEDAAREGMITLTYGELKAEVAVKQWHSSYDPNKIYADFIVVGAKAQAGVNNTWSIILFEDAGVLGEPMTRLTVQLPEANAMHIPDGTYTTENGGFVPNNNIENTQGSYYRYNSVGACIIDATINVTLNKEAATAKISGSFSTAGGEYTFEWDGAVEGFMYEELGEEGITEWTKFILYSQWDDTKYIQAEAAGVKMDIYITKLGGKKSDPIAAGTYPVGDWEYKTTRDYCDKSSTKINGVLLQSGEFVVETVAEGYKVTFNVVDVNGTEWKGTYVGDIPYQPYQG